MGVPIPETEVEISEDGEILTKSPAVFIGYYKMPEETEKTLKDGWVHSGDAVYFDEDGQLIVIDRVKDVMTPVSYTHLRAHETDSYLVCRLLLEKKKTTKRHAIRHLMS